MQEDFHYHPHELSGRGENQNAFLSSYISNVIHTICRVRTLIALFSMLKEHSSRPFIVKSPTAGVHREHGSAVEAAADPRLHPGPVGQPQPGPPPEAEGARRQDA